MPSPPVYTVRFLKAASRDLERLDRTVARQILDRLEWLAKNLHDTKLFPLKGDLRGLYKLREGSYRIGHRRDVYKQR